MTSSQLISHWFAQWEKCAFRDLPITDNFHHTSPFGTIRGKAAYIELVTGNKDKFLNYTFLIIDALYEEDKACVRYKASQGDHFELEVSEWFYFSKGLIERVVAYYHIGEIREDRKLDG